MRVLIPVAMIFALGACALMPGQQEQAAAEPEALAVDQASEQLAVAWQLLFDGRFERAVAGFETVVEQSPDALALKNRALLGQALAYADPNWSGRDLDQASLRLEQAAAGRERDEGVSVSEWALGQTLNRLVQAEQRLAAKEAELTEARSQAQALRAARDQARADQTQAEETVSRLRELIMGQD